MFFGESLHFARACVHSCMTFHPSWCTSVEDIIIARPICGWCTFIVLYTDFQVIKPVKPKTD
jgi:hypothetical protein